MVLPIICVPHDLTHVRVNAAVNCKPKRHRDTMYTKCGLGGTTSVMHDTTQACRSADTKNSHNRASSSYAALQYAVPTLTSYNCMKSSGIVRQKHLARMEYPPLEETKRRNDHLGVRLHDITFETTPKMSDILPYMYHIELIIASGLGPGRIRMENAPTCDYCYSPVVLNASPLSDVLHVTMRTSCIPWSSKHSG